MNLARIMCAHELSEKLRRQTVQTSDITYIRTHLGFAFLAVILDAWLRRVIGYAVSRQIDTRLTIAALHAALENRRPPPGCIHHSDRGSQYASAAY